MTYKTRYTIIILYILITHPPLHFPILLTFLSIGQFLNGSPTFELHLLLASNDGGNSCKTYANKLFKCRKILFVLVAPRGGSAADVSSWNEDGSLVADDTSLWRPAYLHNILYIKRKRKNWKSIQKSNRHSSQHTLTTQVLFGMLFTSLINSSCLFKS